MTPLEISKIRLISQKVAEPEFNTAREIVSWMGAIQAQDYAMSKWAIGIRLCDPSEQMIGSSIDKGEIIRTHLLRPTWHFVASDDLCWMLKLSAPKIKSSMKSRNRELELSEAILKRTNNIIEKKLAGSGSMTRDELALEFLGANIKTDNNRLSHILLWAELNEIACSGPVKNNKLTYALLSERVPHNIAFSRDESLAELARRYFTSRYPATLGDFAWWSNLSLTDARKAIDFAKTYLIPETIGSVKYWVPYTFEDKLINMSSIHLLPAFDELLISYSDRSSSLTLIQNKKIVLDNGIFHPPVVINGQVAGLWKRTFQKNKVIIETDLFQPADKSTKSQIGSKASLFGKFLNKEAEVRMNREIQSI
jgi:hypothetical protein